MAGRTGRGSFGSKEKKASSTKYPLRMGQLLGAYSIGSIYPCDAHTTVMIAGLDGFNTKNMQDVLDLRLAKHIGVKRLLAPPSEEEGFVPSVRFPGWLYCPKCGRMRYYGLFDTSSAPYCNNPDCSKGMRFKPKLVPERFIVVCPEGHIDEFPIMQWVHGDDCPSPGDPKHVITRRTRGGSAVMGDIVYRCSCGKSRSLSGASSSDMLVKVGYSCGARQPWLDRRDPGGCTADPHDLRVVQMGGTNVCYSDTVSSVLIPDSLDPKVKALASKNYERLAEMESKDMLGLAIQMVAETGGQDAEALRVAYDRIKSEGDDALSEGDYLHEEYLTLRNPMEPKKGEFVGHWLEASEYDSPLMDDYFTGVSLIDTLTVTRALVGFSRLSPDVNADRSYAIRRKTLSQYPRDWTLAIQTTGEGIFIELDGEKLSAWRERTQVKRRFSMMQRHLDESTKARKQSPKVLNPDYVALHTLAHLLILGISEVCGYSAASLRERVYCDKYLDGDDRHDDMHGLLVYTASDSSDGSLGGLVRSGTPGRFEGILLGALRKALWCSGDPVCIESHGQGPDSCNLAACYSCALVPETSCETGNKYLDRGLLVGTLDDRGVGLIDVRGAEVEGAGDGAISNLSADFESATDLSGSGFARACSLAIGLCASEAERTFVTTLGRLGEGRHLSYPRMEVTFFDEGDEEADAMLAWEDERVIVLGERAVREFEEAGFSLYPRGWEAFFAGTDDPAEVIDALERRS